MKKKKVGSRIKSRSSDIDVVEALSKRNEALFVELFGNGKKMNLAIAKARRIAPVSLKKLKKSHEKLQKALGEIQVMIRVIKKLRRGKRCHRQTAIRQLEKVRQSAKRRLGT